MRSRPEFDVWVIGVLTSLISLLCLGGMAVLLGLVDPLSFERQPAPKPQAALASARGVDGSPKGKATRAVLIQPSTANLRGVHDAPLRAVYSERSEWAQGDSKRSKSARNGIADSLPRAASSKPAQERATRPAHPQGTQTVTAAAPTGPEPQRTLAQSAPPAEPERKIVKPLGYVEKADGSVEAVVSDEYGVQLVHVGDVYKQKFTVSSIASDAVELVAISHQAEPAPTAVVAANKPKPSTPQPLIDELSQARTFHSAADRDATPSAAPASQTLLPKPTAPSSSPSVGVSLAERRPSSPKPLGSVESANSELATVQRTGRGAERVQFDGVPREGLARKEDSSAISRGADPRQLLVKPPALSREPGPAGEPVPVWRPGGDGLASVASSGLDPPRAPVADERGPPANGSGDPLVVRSYGYAEWQDGRTLAIVDDGHGGVRLVQEGEVVDERFRVVKVYQEAVEIAELPFAPPGFVNLPVLEASAPGPTAPESVVPSSEKSAHIIEAAEVERREHPPPNSTADACGQEQEHADTIVAQVHSPPDPADSAVGQTDEDAAASSSASSTEAGSIGFAQQLEAARFGGWNLLLPSRSVSLSGLLPSVGNADLTTAAASTEGPAATDPPSGTPRQPQSNCHLPTIIINP